MHAYLLDGADEKGRRQVETSLEVAAYDWQIEQERRHAEDHPDAPPLWFTSEADMAAEALALRQQFQVITGGLVEE